MPKNLPLVFLVFSVIGVLCLGGFLALDLALKIVSPELEKMAAQSYLDEGREPSIAEIEQFTRMKLPQNYSKLKAFYRVEKDKVGMDEGMLVKVSANRADIEEALSTAGLFGNLKKNPVERSVSNGGIRIPWWNPDAEKNVVTGYYGWRKPKVKYNYWTIDILVALPEKDPAILYIKGHRY